MRSSPLHRADPAQMSSWMSRVVLRAAGPRDRTAVADLAALDSARPPRDPVLLLEEDGVLRAARSLRDGTVVSDPFARTEHLRALLAAHVIPPREPGRVRAFLARQSRLWDRYVPGRAWGPSGTETLDALRRSRPLVGG